MKQSECQRFKNNWTYLQKVWSIEKDKHNLNLWRLEPMEAGDKAGLCNCNYQKAKQVLMHEIAHALTPGSSHNERWKDKCKELKGDSRLAVTMVPHGMNWAITCSRCRWRQESSSRPHVNGMVCGKCHTPIQLKYIQ